MKSTLYGAPFRLLAGVGCAVTMLACGPSGAVDAGGRADRGVNLPPSPTNLTAIAGDARVTLNWESTVAPEEFRIYYATESGVSRENYTTLAGGGTAVTSNAPFVVTGLENGRMHYFVVTAVIRGNEGGPSEQVAALPTGALDVQPLFPDAARWTYWVANDGPTPFTGSGALCALTSPAPFACLHGGGMKVAELGDVSTCDGVSARDSLDVFEWACVPGIPLRIASLGFKPGRRLADLIDFATLSFRPMGLEVMNGGVPIAATVEETVWWDNPIQEYTDAGLTTSDTIYVLAASQILHATTLQSHVSLTMPDGVVARCNPLEDEVVRLNRNHLWIEGAFSGENACPNVIVTEHVGRSMFRGVRLSNNAPAGSARSCLLLEGSGNQLTEASMEDCAYASVVLAEGPHGIDQLDMLRSASLTLQSSGNWIQGLNVFGVPSGNAVVIDGSYNALVDLRIAGSESTAISFSRFATENVVSNLLAVGSSDRAIRFNQSADNIVIRATVANLVGAALVANGTGIPTSAVGDRTVGQLVANFAAMNVATGLDLDGAETFGVLDAVFAPNRATGISLANGRANVFSGMIGIGAAPLCSVVGGMAPGLINTSCDDGTGSFPGQLSDATIVTALDVSASIVGRVDADTVNAEGGAITTFAEITDIRDFENDARIWGLAGAPSDGVFDPQFQGRCTTGMNCQVWDFSLASGSNPLRDVLSLPTGSDTHRHTWVATTLDGCNMIRGAQFSAGACTSTFLLHAVEIFRDGIGNDNGLCESGETCLYTPNIGAYQGHGARIDAGTIDGGSIENVTLLRFAENGR